VTLRRAVIALAAVGCCLAATGVAQAKAKKHHHHHQRKSHRGHADGGVASEGKAHLKRANELAGDDDCQAAVEEYTKAFVLLDDPSVLFSRAECFRRLGENEHAANDYHLYLDRVPKAANRAEVEAKMAALQTAEPPEREKPAAEPPPSPKVAREKPPAETTPPPPVKEPEATAEPPPPPVAAPAPPPPPAAKPEPVLTLRREPVVDDTGPARGTRPWVWVALAVLVAGAAVGGYFMQRPRPEQPPESALGNYRF